MKYNNEKGSTYIGISPFNKNIRLGALRTFLYTFLFARKYSLNLYIKCDDTNPDSQNQDNFKKQIDFLESFGVVLNNNEKTYYNNKIIHQSENKEVYLGYLDKLIELDVTSEKEGLISLDIIKATDKINKKSFKINDILKHKINFDLVKSGYSFIPLYIKHEDRFLFHIPCVVDEYIMNTEVAIRGEDKIPISPVHDLLRILFDFNPVKYLHLPVILDKNTNKRLKGDQYSIDEFLKVFSEKTLKKYLISSAYSKPVSFQTLKDFLDVFDYKNIKKKSGFFEYRDIEKYN